MTKSQTSFEERLARIQETRGGGAMLPPTGGGTPPTPPTPPKPPYRKGGPGMGRMLGMLACKSTNCVSLVAAKAEGAMTRASK